MWIDALPMLRNLHRISAANPVIAGSFLRRLHVMEYRAKELLQKFGLRVQNFAVVESVEEVPLSVKKLKAREYVVKAQVLAGGRGKGRLTSGLVGGVKLTRNMKDVMSYVRNMIGHSLITKQTGAQGEQVKKVMIAESVEISKETYLAIFLDKELSSPIVIGCASGGMDIEEVAAKSPDLIFKEAIDMEKGILPEQCMNIASSLQLGDEFVDEAAEQIRRLYDMFIQLDALQIEINPFCTSMDSKLYCIDAKLQFDDSAAYRQKEIFDYDQEVERDVLERMAQRNHLHYIRLNGNIGCLVNGAGLAMATMDLISQYGAHPANFLDVGGLAMKEQIASALKIIISDKNVKAILINIFGGIVDCELVATALQQTLSLSLIKVPIVVRFEGTNAQKALDLLSASRADIITAINMDDAVHKVVNSLKGTRSCQASVGSCLN